MVQHLLPPALRLHPYPQGQLPVQLSLLVVTRLLPPALRLHRHRQGQLPVQLSLLVVTYLLPPALRLYPHPQGQLPVQLPLLVVTCLALRLPSLLQGLFPPVKVQLAYNLLATPRSGGSNTSAPSGRSPVLCTFLTLPSTSSTLKSSKLAQKRVSRARVLTSAEHLGILEAKEQKKRQELEDKEKRKAERLEKKRKREEETKRKAEERKEEGSWQKSQFRSRAGETCWRKAGIGSNRAPKDKEGETNRPDSTCR